MKMRLGDFRQEFVTCVVKKKMGFQEFFIVIHIGVEVH